MEKEDFTCQACDSEFSIEHFGESKICFCPFCGAMDMGAEDESDGYSWGEDDELEDE